MTQAYLDLMCSLALGLALEPFNRAFGGAGGDRRVPVFYVSERMRVTRSFGLVAARTCPSVPTGLAV
jgi:hypothetical protein